MEAYTDYTYEELAQMSVGDTHKIKYVRDTLGYITQPHECYVPVLRDDVIQYVPLQEVVGEERERMIRVLASLWIIKDKVQALDMPEWKMEFNMCGEYFPYNAVYLTSQQKNVIVGRESERTYKQAADVWGIPRTLDIASKAALFYLLYTRSLRRDKRATEELEYFIADLAPNVAAYLDMVAGGEARHMISKHLRFEPGRGHAPADVEKEGLNSPYVKINGDGIVYLADSAGRDLTSTQIGGHDRAYAWINWKKLRSEYGIHALDWCIMAHCTVQDGGYGGPLWANCANLVRKRELGEVKDLMFIDQAFSLQHNGGPIFNKLWDTRNIISVLDNAFKGDVQKNEAYLTTEDKSIYRKATYGITAYDGVRHGSSYKPHDKTLDEFKQSSILKIKAQETLEAING